MGTTNINKLLQKALWKWIHSSRQPEAAIVTYWQIQHWLQQKRQQHVRWYDDTGIDTTYVQWWEWWWWIFGFWINIADNLLILVSLIGGFNSRVDLLVLETGATYTRVYMVVPLIKSIQIYFYQTKIRCSLQLFSSR